MDTELDTSVKSRFLDLLARGQAEQERFVAQLSEADREEVGTAEHWSAKDHLAHIAAWQGQSARILGMAAQGEVPEPAPDEREYNAQVAEANRNRPWTEVVADVDAIHAALVAAVAACSDADLTDPDRFPWREGRALSSSVLGNGYEHPADHYAQFYLDRGDLARAGAAKEAAVETTAALFGRASEQYGNTIYNLGCYYALTGQAGPALDAVRTALGVNPGLREWAAQDTDLVSLHTDPAFQALIAA